MRHRASSRNPIRRAAVLAVALAAVGGLAWPSGTRRGSAAPGAATGAAAEPSEETGAVDRFFFLGPPAAVYETGADEANDGPGLQAVRGRFGGLRVSASLSRAAGQCARFAAIRGAGSPPHEFVQFALRWGGAIDPSPWVTTVRTTEEDCSDILAEVERGATSGAQKPTHIGLGRAPSQVEPFRWVWVAILVERRVELAPVPRRAEPGARLAVRFALPAGLSAPRLLHLAPDGAIARARATKSNAGWQSEVAVGNWTGEHVLEILADGAYGPEVLALAPVWVGLDPPTTYTGPDRATEGEAARPPAVEAHLLDLANGARRTAGLAPLRLDPQLAEVARRHSEDMARNAFFGHESPRTGSLGDRLRVAGVRVQRAAENLSRSESAREAHDAIMRSPGHRANVLSPLFTRVGIGVAEEIRGGLRLWVITEDFALPAVGDGTGP